MAVNHNDYDFSGWATRNDIKCSDGRTIRRDAFKDNDGQRVSLVWNHGHNDPLNVLGHADLENRPEGVYMYGKFNDTEAGQHIKKSVLNGDVRAISIYANHLKQNGGDVIHGQIREVSLVLSGANPGAYIDNVIMHGEEAGEEAVIYTGEPLELVHADDDKEEKVVEKEEPKAEEKKPEEPKNDDKETKDMAEEKTVKDVLDTLTEEQKTAVYFVIGQAIEEAQKGGNDDDEEDEDVKHNVFSDYEEDYGVDVLSHSDIEAIFSDAKRTGSLKESVLAHTDDYGSTNIDFLFPDAKSVTPTPEWIKRDTDWVDVLMSNVSRSPFSRIKSVFANITEDQARAKGYLKKHMKKEEVFSLLKRPTSPQTIYKKQKIDRDDVIDITDFDVVAWIKGEMRIMHDEEIARAILVGDGRLNSDDDHISEDCIRPIYNDADLYTIKKSVEVAANATDSVKAAEFIKGAIKARKDYKGSGNPICFMTEDMLTDCLLLEDGIGRTLYANVEALATKLRVSKIVTVPVMDNIVDENRGKLEAVIVNLKDYKVGADKGGAVNMFDDFDIDYNQQKYLIETRCSGALVKPYAAISVFVKEASGTNEEPDSNDDSNEG
jgi:HK97 family phage prohead protease